MRATCLFCAHASVPSPSQKKQKRRLARALSKQETIGGRVASLDAALSKYDEEVSSLKGRVERREVDADVASNLIEMIGGQQGRLSDLLREQKLAIYGVQADIHLLRGGP